MKKTYTVYDMRKGITGDPWTVTSDSPLHALEFLGYEDARPDPKGQILVESDSGVEAFSAWHQTERGWMSER